MLIVEIDFGPWEGKHIWKNTATYRWLYWLFTYYIRRRTI